jgi:hypothetical protein
VFDAWSSAEGHRAQAGANDWQDRPRLIAEENYRGDRSSLLRELNALNASLRDGFKTGHKWYWVCLIIFLRNHLNFKENKNGYGI